MAKTVRLVDLQVVDVDEGTVYPATIDIRDERIVQISRVGGASTESENADAEIHSLDGRYVAPGMINMHNHFSLSLPGTRGEKIDAMDDAEMTLHIADAARKTLHAGVTSTRSVAERDHLDFVLRRAIEEGIAEGPRIFTAGQALVCTGGHGFSTRDTVECDGEVGFTRGVRSQVKLGADLIKIMISGGIAGEHEKIDTVQLTDAEMRAAVETAHGWGRKVTVHAGPDLVTRRAVELGVDCVEHGYQLTEDTLKLMAERGTSYVPTLGVSRCKEFFDELGVPEWMQQRSFAAGDRHVESYQTAIRAGVDLLAGSDLPPFWMTGGAPAFVCELEYMNTYGLDTVDTLRAGTSGPARWLGRDDLGRIAEGCYADFVAMRENPFDATSALRGIDWVMKGGDVVRDSREAGA